MADEDGEVGQGVVHGEQLGETSDVRANAIQHVTHACGEWEYVSVGHTEKEREKREGPLEGKGRKRERPLDTERGR